MTEDATQYSGPRGEEGRRVMESMNEHHVPLWEECMKRMPRSVDGSILDVGCGGGGLLKRLSERYPYSMLFGVDITEDALEFTSETNRGIMDCGGLELHQASVDDLPFAEGSFDMVTAVETYFFWPSLEDGIREISRVLSPGGVLIVGCEITTSRDPPERIAEMRETYGATIVSDERMMEVFDTNGLDGEAFVVGPGVVYRGVKRF